MWIDMARGYAMLSILLFQTNSYNFEELLIPYKFYVENFITLFFFISGFLFYRENIEFDIKHKIQSILKTLVLPYFIFTLSLSIPNALAQGNELSTDMLISIICGKASWFITALIVAELLFSILIQTQKYSKYIMPAVCFACGISAVYFSSTYNLWHYQNAMIAMPYLYMGYIYHKHEIPITWFVNNKVFITAALVFLIAIKFMEYSAGMNMIIEPVIITSFLLFFIDTMMFITLFILFIRHHRPRKFIYWIGKNSMIYYFLCGIIPLLTNRLLTYLGVDYGNSLLILLAITLSVYVTTTIITYFIVKYIPFVTGKF